MIYEQLIARAIGTADDGNTTMGGEPTWPVVRLRQVIAKRRKRLMWLTGAALSAGSGLMIIVSAIVHALQAEYAEGLRADANGTVGTGGPDGVPSITWMLIGVALIAVAFLAVLMARFTGLPAGRQSTNPAG